MITTATKVLDVIGTTALNTAKTLVKTVVVLTVCTLGAGILLIDVVINVVK